MTLQATLGYFKGLAKAVIHRPFLINATPELGKRLIPLAQTFNAVQIYIDRASTMSILEPK